MPLIRSVTENDLPELQEMVCGLARHHGDSATLTLDDLRRDALGAPPWLIILVAEAGERLLGYAALLPLGQLQFGIRGMDLHHLFIRENARGRGVGRMLVGACIDVARDRGCRFLAVGTSPRNQAAQDTYRALGFDQAPQAGPRFRVKW